MPEASRPDPDALLTQIRNDEARALRGRLRIYFGASAGVGKTWAMLAAAQRELAAGRSVLIGVIETHGRSETAALLTGLERLPLRDIADRGRTLSEFDIDAALARMPTLLLVDELAHSNAPGSRHAKRWQDVQELLSAGIDVWSAVNVQHLESLNGTVGAITGVRVHETVPDSVLDEADEVVLIDVTPDELLARLAAGKVYLSRQGDNVAERAAKNFFRKGNLIALREIALRRTAEHVEDDMRGWRVEQSGTTGGLQAWNTSGAILACVGPNEGAAQTVRTAARLAGQLNVRWHAAYVETPRLQRLPAAKRDRILRVLKLAEELGAATAVLTGTDAAQELTSQARRINCATLVIGRAEKSLSWRRWWPSTSLSNSVANLAPTLDIMEAGRSESSRQLNRPVLDTTRSMAATAEISDSVNPLQGRWRGYIFAIAMAIAITVIAAPLSNVLEQVNIVLLFLLGVIGIAMRFGRGPAAFTALLNVAAFDFFFVAPRLSFAVSDIQYVVTFAVMLSVGLLVGQLTAGLRFAAGISTSRERRAQSLFELTRELSAALESAQVVEHGTASVQRHFGGQALIIVTDPDDRLIMPSGTLEGFDPSVADWAYRQGQSAGLATNTLSAQPWHYVPLKAPMRVRGVLAICPAHPRWLLIPEQYQQLDTLARQIAIALERVHYVEVAQKAVVDMESERLRTTLLAAISHDVRTPLTALIGMAESLEFGTSDERLITTKALVSQARELNALVNNLLDMARLEAGAVKGNVQLRKEWHSVEEVVGSAIRSAGLSLDNHPVKTSLPSDLPLVEFDAVLIERVLVNLLGNAAKYGLPPITVSACTTVNTLALTVRDCGTGIPAELEGREHFLFEKFTRGNVESSTPGVGLGLAICKAIVLAHGGEIHATNAIDGGAIFTFTLIRRTPPASTEANQLMNT